MKLYTLIFTMCIMIGCVPLGPGVYDFTIDLGNGYVLARCYNDVVFIGRKEVSVNGKFPRIESKVLSVGWDDRYILAERQVVEENGTPIPDKIEFYIIDTKDNAAMGPYARTEFDQMVNKIETKAELRNIYEYNK